MNKQNRIAVFNRVSGVFVAFTDNDNKEHMDDTYYKFKVIDIDEDKEVWSGDFETGSVESIDDIPVEVTEESLNLAASSVILDTYPLGKQLNIVQSLLTTIIEANPEIVGESVDEFKSMVNFISGRRKLNKKFKNVYSEGDDWTYTSSEEAASKMSQQMAGGLHELGGPQGHQLAWMPCGQDGD
tara:strand:+ start:440 stop:991 length:552 start_codon:yes stop_codon:yes gene_type:complete